jgi:chromosome segregation ATPase
VTFDQTAADLISYKAKIANLESKVDTYEREAKKRHLEEQQALNEGVEKVKQKDEKIEELRRQRSVLFEREKTVSEQLETTRDKMESDRKSYEQRIQEIGREKDTLKHKLDETQDAAQTKIAQMNGLLTKHQRERVMMESQIMEIRAKLDISTQRNEQCAFRLAQLEEYEQRALKAEHRVKELECIEDQFQEKAKVVEHSYNQLMRFNSLEQKCSKLEKENSKLQRLADNNALLMEQKESIEAKLERAEARLVAATKLELENDDLKKMARLWEATDSAGVTRKRTPQEMSRMLAELQQRHDVVVEEKGQLITRSFTLCLV